MTWLEWTAAMADAIAWPGAFIVAILLFRKVLRDRIRHVRRAKWGDRELEFERTLEEAEEMAKPLPPPSQESPNYWLDVLHREGASPSAVVEQFWSRVIDPALEYRAHATGVAWPPPSSISDDISHLVRSGALVSSDATLLRRLRKLARLARLGPSVVDWSAAARIVFLGLRLTERLYDLERDDQEP